MYVHMNLVGDNPSPRIKNAGVAMLRCTVSDFSFTMNVALHFVERLMNH